MQRVLTNEAIATADKKVSKAMQASGTASKFMYRNGFRAVHVKKGDPWHSIITPVLNGWGGSGT